MQICWGGGGSVGRFIVGTDLQGVGDFGVMLRVKMLRQRVKSAITRMKFGAKPEVITNRSAEVQENELQLISAQVEHPVPLEDAEALCRVKFKAQWLCF